MPLVENGGVIGPREFIDIRAFELKVSEFHVGEIKFPYIAQILTYWWMSVNKTIPS